MAGFVEMKVRGDKETIRALHQLGEHTQKKVVKKAVRKGALVFLGAMRKNLDARKRARAVRVRRVAESAQIGLTKARLRDLLIIHEETFPGGIVNATVGVSIEGTGRWAHLVEWGSEQRFTKRGLYRGKMPALLFATRALHAQEFRVRSGLENDIKTGVEREAAKRGRG